MLRLIAAKLLSYINYEKSTDGALPDKAQRGMHDTWNYGDSALIWLADGPRPEAALSLP